MDVMAAAFGLVREAPGGATALGPVIGKSGTSLAHEVNPNYAGAKLGLADAVALSEWTGDRRILNAFAAVMACMVIPLPSADAAGSGMAERTAQLAREFADLMGEVASDLADGQVSGNELQRIEREAGQLSAALQQLLAEIRRLHLAGLPAEGAA